MILALGRHLQRLSPAARWRLVLGLAGVVVVVILIFTAKPWDITARAGANLKLKDIVRAYSWWAALANLGGIVVLAALCPWWAGARQPQAPSLRPPLPRWFWPLVGAAMVVTAACAFQRLNHSLWDDEEYALRRGVIGAYERKGERPPALDRLSWQETFFAYKKPTNHVFYSILARVSLGAWSLATPKGGPFFSEPVYRLPAYLAGIASVAALAWLLADFGLAAAGVGAAFLLALHPWHLRYASEARGYSLILLVIPLLLLAWKRGMENGRWTAWAAFGAGQFALLYTWPGTLYLLFLVNLLTAVLFLLKKAPREWAGRWFACTALAAMLVVQLMLPLVPQMRAYLSGSKSPMGFYTEERCRVIFGHLALGAPWRQTGDGTYPEIFPGVVSDPRLAAVLGGLALLLFFGGWFLWARRSPRAFAVCAVLVLAPVLSGVHAWYRNFPVFEWYFLYGILAVCPFCAVSLAWLGEVLASRWSARWLAAAPAAAAVAGYGLLSHPVRAWHLSHPVQQIRESVQITRPLEAPLDPSQENILTVGFIIPPHVYDAQVILAKSPEKFFDLLRRADSENKPLLVNVGHPWTAHRECPVQWAAIHDESLFEAPLMLRGLDPGLDRVVARYRPGAIATYQFQSKRPPVPEGGGTFSAQGD
jgi:uncharacterized membrane protein YdcZ (DUF606 family)